MLLLAALVSWMIFIYNRLLRDRQRVKTAWSDIDVQLKRRFDLIPKLVAAVEQYARYEQTTLKTLIELRSRTGRVSEVAGKGALENLIGSGLRSLIALAEAYTELKADQCFLQLQDDLTEVENQIHIRGQPPYAPGKGPPNALPAALRQFVRLFRKTSTLLRRRHSRE